MYLKEGLFRKRGISLFDNNVVLSKKIGQWKMYPFLWIRCNAVKQF